MRYLQGNLFDHIAESSLLIPHLCNNEGLWGRGFVIPLADRYPKAKESYERLFRDGRKPPLGHVDYARVADNVTVANMIAQVIDLPGAQDMEWMGVRPVRYNALATCMDGVADHIVGKDIEIYCPLFGAGIAGGDWMIIKELICDCWESRDIPVTVFYLPQFPPPDLAMNN
jgi:hypothetical protein